MKMDSFRAQKMIQKFMHDRKYNILSESPLFARRQFDDIDVEASFDPVKNEFLITVWKGSDDTEPFHIVRKKGMLSLDDVNAALNDAETV